MKDRIYNLDTVSHVGKTVTVSGWVQTRRDHGRIIFLDMRDRTGLLQVVVAEPKLVEKLQSQNVGREWVLQITGEIVKRGDKMANPQLPTGTVEMQSAEITVLNSSQTPPFEIDDNIKIDEEVRLRYRYLDLRRPSMLKRMQLRQQLMLNMRNWLTERGFIEVETPFLTKDTPEGAREYIVPSRVHPGKGYALPQSPQQFKQLLMVAGFEKYFQFPKCMRDEDPREDRQPEFTQLDIEMSFVDQEEILQMIEELYTTTLESVCPEKKLTFKPFKRLSYDEAMTKYHSDKPDLRQDKSNWDEVALAFVVDFPLFELTKEGKLTSAHHPFTSWQPTPENDELMEKVRKGEKVDIQKLLKIKANSYDLVANGLELGSGSIRIHRADQQEAIFKALELSDTQIKERFGHMLEAFSYGCPPHGGMAPGIDRLIMAITGLSIREVIAFPKTGDGRDLMMNAPAELSPELLKDLHLQKIEKK
ncbi:MAG: aspartate--tRNA ligase [Patescibacteria group bacterium]|jgi:aspartyl-tRNA synthetase